MEFALTRRQLLAMPFAQASTHAAPALTIFFDAASPEERNATRALRELERVWRPGYAAMLVDLILLLSPLRRTSPESTAPTDRVIERLVAFLEARTRQRFGRDMSAWQRWLWSLPYEPHPEFGEFKGYIYDKIDPKMRSFFPPGVKSRIRFDRISWGGVVVNGIPPLVRPKTIAAGEASYLKDNHVVFGISWKGQSRAYPKRILAWHEMAIDRVGGQDLTIVYCTLCGTVIPYFSAGHAFGTSGLLYESSKLMFDEATNSLWPTLEGVPGVGPLTGTSARLDFAPVVTTTWGEWRQSHPETTVLSLDTGHRRDYSEGAAYRTYFASDELMFPVSVQNKRLKNKDEVLILRLPGKTPLAIASRRLKNEPVFQYEHEGERLLVLTTPAAANRVYRAGNLRWHRDASGVLRDDQNREWQVEEDGLQRGDQRLDRWPAHRAFWFGWFTQNPQGVLVR
jgi:hypothetical protein